jgi:hypothetical protein
VNSRAQISKGRKIGHTNPEFRRCTPVASNGGDAR